MLFLEPTDLMVLPPVIAYESTAFRNATKKDKRDFLEDCSRSILIQGVKTSNPNADASVDAMRELDARLDVLCPFDEEMKNDILVNGNQQMLCIPLQVFALITRQIKVTTRSDSLILNNITTGSCTTTIANFISSIEDRTVFFHGSLNLTSLFSPEHSQAIILDSKGKLIFQDVANFSRNPPIVTVNIEIRWELTSKNNIKRSVTFLSYQAHSPDLTLEKLAYIRPYITPPTVPPRSLRFFPRKDTLGPSELNEHEQLLFHAANTAFRVAYTTRKDELHADNAAQLLALMDDPHAIIQRCKPIQNLQKFILSDAYPNKVKKKLLWSAIAQLPHDLPDDLEISLPSYQLLSEEDPMPPELFLTKMTILSVFLSVQLSYICSDLPTHKHRIIERTTQELKQLTQENKKPAFPIADIKQIIEESNIFNTLVTLKDRPHLQYDLVQKLQENLKDSNCFFCMDDSISLANKEFCKLVQSNYLSKEQTTLLKLAEDIASVSNKKQYLSTLRRQCFYDILNEDEITPAAAVSRVFA